MSMARTIVGNALLSILGNLSFGQGAISAGDGLSSAPKCPVSERIARIKGMMKKRSRRDAQRRRWNRRRMAKLSRRKNYQVLGRRG